MKYKAIIFDLFGTLIDKLSLQEHKNILRQMASTISAPPDDFIKLWFDTFNERGLGVFQSIKENVVYICQKLELPMEDAKIAQAARINIEYIARAMKPRPHAHEVISYLKAHNHKTGLISDCSAEIPGIFNTMSLALLIDVAVFSCMVGMQKPDRRIYQLTAERLSVKPEDCIYIGDGDSNELTGSLKAGMNPVLILNPTEDRADVHRVDWEGETWHGPVITSLKEVLNLLK